MTADAGLLPPALAEVRSFDGTGNHQPANDFGVAGAAFLRLAANEYADGASAPAGGNRLSARAISSGIAAQSVSELNARGLSDFVWIWGQFLDHDLDLTGSATPAEPLAVQIPTGDPFFDPQGTGTATIPLSRSQYVVDAQGVRQQVNSITAFIDGSMVYGSDAARARALRTLEGGRLKTSAGDLLPFNTDGLANAGGPSSNLFVAGDIRVNENVALMSIQTLFVREHNRLAGEIAAREPGLSDEQIYQRARSQVIAQIQAITYNEFLPALLGPDALRPYQGYNPRVNPGISNEFATAAFRLGHTLLSPELRQLGADGQTIAAGNLALRNAFFNIPSLLATGIDPLLRGAASQRAQELDNQIVDDVRNFLFGPPGAGGFDLASLNIERGREHGLADYNATRVALGLRPVRSFAEITSDVGVQRQLASLYGDVNHIDLWVGGLAEDHVPGGSVGETFTRILADQFERTRDGDRFWYQNVLRGEALAQVDRTTLADVIARNTGVEGLQRNVFFTKDVLVVNLPQGPRPGDVTIAVDAERVRVLDGAGRTLETRRLADLSRLIVAGVDGRADRVRLDLSRAQSPTFDLELSGGTGPLDTLEIVGHRGADRFALLGQTLRVNGQSADVIGFESIIVHAEPRTDQVTVQDPGPVRVLLAQGNRLVPAPVSIPPAPAPVTPPRPAPREAPPPAVVAAPPSSAPTTPPAARTAPPAEAPPALEPRVVDAAMRLLAAVPPRATQPSSGRR